MTFHPEILSSAQDAVLRRLGPLAAQNGFYLGGGTAVALHLGHRRSDDLDWFTAGPLPDPLALAGALQAAGLAVSQMSAARGTLHCAVNGVRASFLHYRYPLLGPLAPWPERGCALASLEDLACMKLLALLQRGSRKDFIDVYALRDHVPAVAALLELCQRKFGLRDESRLLYALTYFDDAEHEAMPRMLRRADWQRVKKGLRQWVKDYLRKGS